MPAPRRTQELDLDAYDEIIDVRSPAEFAEDHIPGAVNLPVLSDAERAEVGAIYVREDRFRARKIGAALVTRNIARHLETHFRDKPGGYRPLVLCWRGGQRSGAMAWLLSEIGFAVTVLDGGYRAYRRSVTQALYYAEPSFTAVLLDGMTGVGKTEVLAALAAEGAQVIDLEALAAHRGSVFGALPDQPQPSQKSFESALHAALGRLDPAQPIFLEAEANKVGDRLIPPMPWKAMRAAPVIELSAPLAARAAYTLRRYGDIFADGERLDATLARLVGRQSSETVQAWRALGHAGQTDPTAHGALIEALMTDHYDPAYARARQKQRRPAPLAAIALDPSCQQAFHGAARRILAVTAGRLGGP